MRIFTNSLSLALFFITLSASAVQVAWYDGGREKFAAAVTDKSIALRTPRGIVHAPVAGCNRKVAQVLKQKIERFAKKLPRMPKARGHVKGLIVDSVRRATPVRNPAADYFRTLEGEMKIALVQSKRLCKSTRRPAQDETFTEFAISQQDYEMLMEFVNQQCPHCQVDAAGENNPKVEKLLQECRRDLCVNAPAVAGLAEEVDRAIKADAKSDFERSTGPRIRELLASVDKLEQKRLKAMTDLIENPRPSSLEHAILGQVIFDLLKLNLDLFYESQTGDRIVYGQRPDRELDAFYAALTSGQREELISIFNAELTGTQVNLAVTDYSDHPQILFPSENPRQSVRLLAQEVQNKVQRFSKLPGAGSRVGASVFPEVSWELFGRAVGDGPIDDRDIQRLVEDHATVTSLSSFVDGSSIAERKKALVQSLLQNSNAKTVLGQTLAAAGQVDLSAFKESVVANCATAYSIAKVESPTQDQITAFKEKAKKLKSDFSANFISKFSAETAGKLNRAAEQWNFVYPPLASEVDDYFKRELEAQGHAVARSYLSPSLGVSAIRARLDQYCSGIAFEQTQGLDHVFPGSNEIRVSRHSVRHPDYGVNAVTHEMGHLVAFAFKTGKMSKSSAEKYNEARACLTGLHPLGENIRENDFLEEDWADLASAKAVPGGQLTLACVFLPANGSVEDLNFFRAPESEAEFLFRHSMDLFRAMHQTVLTKGKLPATCDQAIASTGVPLKFKDCMP